MKKIEFMATCGLERCAQFERAGRLVDRKTVMAKARAMARLTALFNVRCLEERKERLGASDSQITHGIKKE